MLIKVLLVSGVIGVILSTIVISTVLIFISRNKENPYILIKFIPILLGAVGLLVSTGLMFSVKDDLIFTELSEKHKLTSVVKDDIINSLKPQNTVQSQSDITSNENETVDNIQNQDVYEQEIIVNCYSDDDSQGHRKTTGLLIGIFCIVIVLLIMILLYKSYKKKDIEKTEKTEKSNENSNKTD